jgi:hypothetical protein
MLNGLLTWTAHSEHQEVWAGPSWSSYPFRVRSVLLPGFQDPPKSAITVVCCVLQAAGFTSLYLDSATCSSNAGAAEEARIIKLSTADGDAELW